MGLAAANRPQYAGQFFEACVLKLDIPGSKIYQRLNEALIKMLMISGFPRTLSTLFSLISVLKEDDLDEVKKQKIRQWHDTPEIEEGRKRYIKLTHGEKSYAQKRELSAKYSPDLGTKIHFETPI